MVENAKPFDKIAPGDIIAHHNYHGYEGERQEFTSIVITPLATKSVVPSSKPIVVGLLCLPTREISEKDLKKRPRKKPNFSQYKEGSLNRFGLKSVKKRNINAIVIKK